MAIKISGTNIVSDSQQLRITGVSTFTTGPVFIGAATSTGTASQPLQVTGGAYVSGNLGIGTTNPTVSLQLSPNAIISNVGSGITLAGTVGSALTVAQFYYANTNASYLRIKATRNTTGSDWLSASTKLLQVIDVTEQGYIEYNPNGAPYGMALGQGSTEWARFLSSGNLGIGTTYPGRNLDVNGTVRIRGGLYDVNDQVGSGTSVLLSTGSGVRWTPIATAALQGVQGIQGVQGTQGLQGIQGIQGTQGLQGIQGIQGTQGLQGIQGVQGTQGLQGLQGLQGIQGIQGTQGLQGIQGIQGTQGLQGIQGIQGTQGLQGIQGTQGLQGIQGIQGVQGTLGTGFSNVTSTTSATPVSTGTVTLITNQQGAFVTGDRVRAVNTTSNYFEGTLTVTGGTTFAIVADFNLGTTTASSWTITIAGVRGVQGLQGIQGTQGLQGIQGIQGIQGLQGIQGTQGLQGTSDGGVTVFDNTTTNSNWYVGILSVTSGIARTSYISSTKLVFNPSSGNLGIGTTNPISKLDVRGDVSIASTLGIGTVIDIIPYDTLNSGTLSWEGSAGQLFSITNNLTSGSIFSVNDVSGIPSIDVDANGKIQLGPYGGNIGVGTTNPTSKLNIGAGTTLVAPLEIDPGPVLTTPLLGSIEYDGSFLYHTPNSTSGRASIPPVYSFRRTSSGANIGSATTDFFTTPSSLSLEASSVYRINCFAYFTKNTAGISTWTQTFSSAPTIVDGVHYVTPVTGMVTATSSTYTQLQQYFYQQGSASFAWNPSGSNLTTAVNHFYRLDMTVLTNAATNWRLRLTQSAGTATPLAGSYYKIEKISGSTGTFAA